MNAVQVVPVLCSHPYMNEQLFLQMAAMKDLMCSCWEHLPTNVTLRKRAWVKHVRIYVRFLKFCILFTHLKSGWFPSKLRWSLNQI